MMEIEQRRKLNILLIDDDEEEFILLQDILANRPNPGNKTDPWPYTLDWVCTYEAGLNALTTDRHDVYLVDYFIGPRNGLELLGEAREMGVRSPIIMLTGHENYDIDVAAARTGASDFLVKNQIDAMLLDRSIRYAIERVQAETALRKAQDELEQRVEARTVELTRANQALKAEIEERRRTEELNKRLYQELQSVLLKEQNMRDQLVQAEKHTAISRMVASVAHELSNPMQTIQNCLYLIEQELAENSPIFSILEMAQSEGHRVIDLVNQLRDIYRPEKLGPHQPIQVLDLLTDVECLLTPYLQQQNVSWKLINDHSSACVYGIANQIKQVFMNICMNAIEAMEPGGGVLTIEIRQPGSERVGIAFSDSGAGIAAENITRLFEPFFTTKESGTGLGLAICFEIVQKHNGQITVESEVGKGATFTVWLPKYRAGGI